MVEIPGLLPHPAAEEIPSGSAPPRRAGRSPLRPPKRSLRIRGTFNCPAAAVHVRWRARHQRHVRRSNAPPLREPKPELRLPPVFLSSVHRPPELQIHDSRRVSDREDFEARYLALEIHFRAPLAKRIDLVRFRRGSPQRRSEWRERNPRTSLRASPHRCRSAPAHTLHGVASVPRRSRGR